MSRNVTVYTRKPVGREALLERLAEQGTPLDWTPSFPVAQGTDWSEGDFHPAGSNAGEWAIELFEEELVPALRDSAMSAYRDVMSETQRQALMSARRAFRLTVPAGRHQARDRALSTLAVTIAELGAGVIADSRTNRVYDAASYAKEPSGGATS